MLHRTKMIAALVGCIVLASCHPHDKEEATYDCKGIEKELVIAFEVCIKGDNVVSVCTRQTKELLCKKVPQSNAFVEALPSPKRPTPLLSPSVTPGE